MLKPVPVLAVCLSAALATAAHAQEDLSATHKKMYAKVAPSVVFVMGEGRSGSGAIIDKDGYILTSPTACGLKGTDVTVQLKGLKRVPGKVAGRINDLELVIVKINEKDLPVLELGDSDAMKLGAVTYAFGDSFGSIQSDDQPAMSLGAMSSAYTIDQKLGPGSQYTGPVLETSAAVNQQQDGGPLVDARGRIIGVITLNYQESKFTGLAVPINRLKPEIERIIQEHKTGVVSKPVAIKPDHKVEAGWLGADVAEVEDTPGLSVKRVSTNGPAEQGGLRKGDIIREINGKRVLTMRTFEATMGQLEAGVTVELAVVRNERERIVKVVLAKKVFY